MVVHTWLWRSGGGGGGGGGGHLDSGFGTATGVRREGQGRWTRHEHPVVSPCMHLVHRVVSLHCPQSAARGWLLWWTQSVVRYAGG